MNHWMMIARVGNEYGESCRDAGFKVESGPAGTHWVTYRWSTADEDSGVDNLDALMAIIRNGLIGIGRGDLASTITEVSGR